MFLIFLAIIAIQMLINLTFATQKPCSKPNSMRKIVYSLAIIGAMTMAGLPFPE